MSRHVITLHVQPQDAVRFPGICVHCARPAPASMALAARRGQTVREIKVPLCAECAAALARESGDEERLRKIGRLLAGVAGLALLMLILLLTPARMALWARLLIGLPPALAAAALIFWLARPAIERAALPEKQAIRQAAQIANFDWETTTFIFANETFAERFQALNQERVARET